MKKARMKKARTKMNKDTEKTEVMFRVWRGEIIALFPYIIASPDSSVSSYMHIGQHGAADDTMIIRRSKPAKEEYYAGLKAELENGFGYNLKVIRKRDYKKFREAYKQFINR